MAGLTKTNSAPALASTVAAAHQPWPHYVSFLKYWISNCCWHPAGVIYCTTRVTRDFIALPLGPIGSPEWYIINKIWSPQLCFPHCKDGMAAITLYLFTVAMTWYYMGACMPLCTSFFFFLSLFWCAHCGQGEAERRDRWAMFDQLSLHLLSFPSVGGNWSDVAHCYHF